MKRCCLTVLFLALAAGPALAQPVNSVDPAANPLAATLKSLYEGVARNVIESANKGARGPLRLQAVARCAQLWRDARPRDRRHDVVLRPGRRGEESGGRQRGEDQEGQGRDRRKIMKEYDILINPLSTEKSVRLIESQNKLVFVVAPKSTKKDIKKAVETMFNVKVKSVNTEVSKGRKIAFVTLPAEFSALDVATKLGIL